MWGGEPCGFVIEMENGFRIWHMGDTGVFGDMRLLGELYKPDLLLIPIGGGQFVMNPADAAMATRDMTKPRMAIPMHYGTTPALSGTPGIHPRPGQRPSKSPGNPTRRSPELLTNPRSGGGEGEDPLQATGQPPGRPKASPGLPLGGWRITRSEAK